MHSGDLMSSLKKAKIAAIARAVPEKILTNFDLEKMVDTTDEWIRTRTGIEERHIADEKTTSSVLGIEATKKALKKAGISAEELDFIIVATITPDMVFPATACIIQNAIGAVKAATMDIEAACSGFIYGLSIARQYIATGEAKNILVVASEVLSKITDWDDRSTCILFGDGAGAAIITESDSDSEIMSTVLGGDGKYGDILYLPAGGSKKPASHETVDNKEHTIKMNGQDVFKAAVTKMRSSLKKALEKAGIKSSQLKLVIPHQANLRIIESLRKFLDLPKEKVYVNLQKYGNTSAASIAIAMSEAEENGIIKRGDYIALCAFGGGLTWAATVIKY